MHSHYDIFLALALAGQCIRTQSGRCSGSVIYAPEPYEQDVNGDETKVWECQYHRWESAQEV